MQTLIPPHNLVLYKIIKDFEEKEKKVHSRKDLMDFSFEAMKEAEKISGEKYCLYFSGAEYDMFFNKRLQEFCDFTNDHIILNAEKYFAKPYLLQERLAALQGDLLEGAKRVLNSEFKKEPDREK